MNNLNDLNSLYGGGYSPYSFDRFKADFPQYLDKLNGYILLLYNTYVLLHNKRYRKIKKNPQCLELAQKCGIGMLMRHAMETMVTSIATENGVEVGGRSVFERLEALKGQNVAVFDNTKRAVLSKLLDMTNSIAHPHIGKDNASTYDELNSFYLNSFSAVLDSHISYMDELIRKARTHDFGITKEAAKSRKQSYKYLLEIQARLDCIDVSDKMTSTLIQGCLVRQLTECTANLWCYNYGIVPTDASTFENQINLSKVLDSLAQVARAGKKNAFGTSALTTQVVSHLYDLKSASNNLMHVEKFAASNLERHGAELSRLYNVVKTECSPHVMTTKLSNAGTIGKQPVRRVREKSPTVAAILCGLFGWIGAHQFYAGKIAKGILYLLFGGFIIFPTIDLYKILRGKFRDSRRLRIGKTTLSTVIALILLAGHLFAWYNLGTKLRNDGTWDKIKSFNLMQLVTMQKCDNAELDTMTKITVANATSTSYLESENANFDAAQCVDGYPSTCWQEGSSGNGEGESLTFTFDAPKKISAISVLNGKHTSEKAYTDNARASKLIVKTGKLPYFIDMEDIMQRQTFTFAKPIETNEITITVVSSYAGNVWEDLCISEIEFYASPDTSTP